MAFGATGGSFHQLAKEKTRTVNVQKATSGRGQGSK